MLGRLKLTLAIAAIAAILAPAAEVAAQDGGRFRGRIPYFQPLEGAKDNFGKDASKDLREMMQNMATHVAMEEGDIKDEVKNFDMKIEDLDCIRTRQLAAQIDVPVAICASSRYTAKLKRGDAPFFSSAISSPSGTTPRERSICITGTTAPWRCSRSAATSGRSGTRP